jgi:glycosyltransferase involved in cell wall biosynthesis
MTDTKKDGLRICVISGPLFNTVGGDTFLKQFMKILEPLLFQKLYLITGGFSVPDTEKVQVIGKRKGWIVTDSIIKRIYRNILAQWRSSIDLIKIVRHCDLIILYSGTSCYVIPALIGKLCRKNVILVHQGSYSNPFRIAYGKRWLGLGILFYRALWLLEETVFHLVDKIVMESKSVIKFSKLDGYRKKLCLGDYCYIDTDVFKIEKGLSERKKIVGYMGQFIEIKGVESLAKAVPLILVEDSDIQFVLIGKIGSTMVSSRIEQELKRTNTYDKVTIMSRVHPRTVPNFLNEMRLFVLPSLGEGLPGVVRQAMACGTPVLATPVGGVPDLIKDGESGFIMEDNSPDCIAGNVIRALNHPNLDEIAKNARALIEREFTYEKAVERYRKILDNTAQDS